MNTKKFDVNKMRIASPCPARWESMKGDAQKRFCSFCDLNVYNISELTTEEVRALVLNSSGRICARIYKRSDGTILTSDCPVGIRAYRQRVSGLAAAIFTAIISLCAVVFGQTDPKKDKKNLTSKDIKIVRTTSQNKLSSLKATVTDQNGALVPGAKIVLQKKDKKISLKTQTSDEGDFNFSLIPTGEFSLEIISPGFKPFKINKIEIKENEILQFNAVLETADIVMGIIVEGDSLIDISSSGGSTTITKKALDKLPIN